MTQFDSRLFDCIRCRVLSTQIARFLLYIDGPFRCVFQFFSTHSNRFRFVSFHSIFCLEPECRLVELPGDVLELVSLQVGLDSLVGLDAFNPRRESGPAWILDALGAIDEIRTKPDNRIVERRIGDANGRRASPEVSSGSHKLAFEVVNVLGQDFLGELGGTLLAGPKDDETLVSGRSKVVGVGNRSIGQVSCLVAIGVVVFQSHLEIAQSAGLSEDRRGLEVDLLVVRSLVNGQNGNGKSRVVVGQGGPIGLVFGTRWKSTGMGVLPLNTSGGEGQTDLVGSACGVEVVEFDVGWCPGCG